MKVRVELVGHFEEEIPPDFSGSPAEVNLETPITLHYLLTEILKIRDTDKVVLTNGKYMALNYVLHDGDRVQIFPRLDGG